jgi:ABC-2 type transport system permease protein
MAVAIPLLLLVLFGYALTLDVDHVPMVVWDQSHSPASRDLIGRFAASHSFSLQGEVDNARDLEQAVDSGRAVIALVVPWDFAASVATGRPASIQLIVDGSDSNTATVAMGYADLLVETYSQELVVRKLRRAVQSRIEPPIDARGRVWFNAELESKNSIIPGLIAIIMMIIAALLTSLSVAREWENGTMEKILSTPLKGRELVLGKLIPYFAIGMLDVALAVLMGDVLFDVPLRGRGALLFAMASVFMAGALSLGMLISILAKSQLLASQVAIVLTFLPSFLLSGFVYDIGSMPPGVQVVTTLVPARYFLKILRGIYLKGIGLEILVLEALVLTGFAALIVLLAATRLQKKLT